jgi:hypothetical protein
LAVSADQRQGVWVVPFRRGTQRKWRWFFLCLRFVEFRDGQRLVGFSRGCPCPSSDSSRLREQLDCRDRPANVRSWLPAERMCSCGTRLLAQLGGEEALQRLLRLSPPCDDDSSFVETLEVNAVCFSAVRVGSSFADWGTVDSQLRCCTCPSRRHICDHVHEVLPETAEDSVQSSGMSATDFEKKMHTFMDLDAGARRLTCVSKMQLPEQLEDDEELLQLVTGGYGSAIMCAWQDMLVFMRSWTDMAVAMVMWFTMTL